MFFSSNNNDKALLEALDRSQAKIEFDLNGNILHANENFLSAMSYTLEEIKGQHHRIFVAPAYAESAEYAEFWQRLKDGEFFSAEYQRFDKGGNEIWIQASYNPIMGKDGKPSKVVKYATDITAQKLKNADYEGQIEAIGKSQAVIEFNMDGTIREANPNFLNTMGYSLEEIKGQHHSMFAPPGYAESAEYKEFWQRLNNGEFFSAEYQRVGKGGREVWIQASYNPIIDMNGKPFKVIKYATDITAQKLKNADYEGQIEAISKAQAIIEFELSGKITYANQNFLSTMGYTLEEIKGQHHSMFAPPGYAESAEYKNFWQRLNNGEFFSAEYQRVGKGGREIWIQASYNPIMDMNGKPFKVVKYAVDITENMKSRHEASQLSNMAKENVSNIAASTEQMDSAINEITQNMGHTQKAVDDIMSKANRTVDSVTKLQNAAESMQGVIGLIRDIAEQVNLLALNATIEAARAGEAGKGFAVVASEVKNLATQTSNATDSISEEIAAMQIAVSQTSESSQTITSATSSVSEYVNTTASAIEEQSAVMKDISNRMHSIASGVDDLNECVAKALGQK